MFSFLSCSKPVQRESKFTSFFFSMVLSSSRHALDLKACSCSIFRVYNSFLRLLLVLDNYSVLRIRSSSVSCSVVQQPVVNVLRVIINQSLLMLSSAVSLKDSSPTVSIILLKVFRIASIVGCTQELSDRNRLYYLYSISTNSFEMTMVTSRGSSKQEYFSSLENTVSNLALRLYYLAFEMVA